MEQLKNNSSLYSKPHPLPLHGTAQIKFNVGHPIKPIIETQSHWFFGFPQRLFNNTFGRFCNYGNESFVFFSTMLIFIVYFSEKNITLTK
jgi:hypothetical protein